MSRGERIFTVCLTLLLSAAANASADVYRCTDPDGRLVFTDDESTCPGAPKYEPAGAVQLHRSEEPPPADIVPPATQTTPDPIRADGRSAMKQHWQAKKRASEDELRMLEERSEYLSRFVTGCNRGAGVTTSDETGIKRTVSCEKIRAEYEQSLARQKPIRDYLDGGLQRECREAGCLPGWIR